MPAMTRHRLSLWLSCHLLLAPGLALAAAAIPMSEAQLRAAGVTLAPLGAAQAQGQS